MAAELAGKTALVTGATSGIGRQAARILAAMGARVIAVGRSAERAQALVGDIARAGGSAEVALADLSSMAEVRRLAAGLERRHPRLHLLVNNAGAVNLKRELTVDGLERTFATNHLAPFLLTHLLLPQLLAAAPARVVTVASSTHAASKIAWEDLQSEKGYWGWRAYGMSKLCNVLFTRALAAELQGTGVTANCVHPGYVASDFLSKGGVWKVLKPAGNLFAVSEETGARRVVAVATAPELAGVSGAYFSRGRRVEPSAAARDPGQAARLWEASAKLCGL